MKKKQTKPLCKNCSNHFQYCKILCTISVGSSETRWLCHIAITWKTNKGFQAQNKNFSSHSSAQNPCMINSILIFNKNYFISTYSVSRSWPGLCGAGTSINSKTLRNPCHRNVDVWGCNASWIFDGRSTSCIAIHILLTCKSYILRLLLVNYLLFHYCSKGFISI